LELEQQCWTKVDDFGRDGKTVIGAILTFNPINRPVLLFKDNRIILNG
jgi:hypothetical protein